MRLQDRFQLFTSYALSTILALVIGAAYLNQPLNAAGAFTRVSVIFAYHVVLRFEHARKTALLDIGLTDSMPPSFPGRIEYGLTRISLICGDAYVVRIVLCFLFQLIRVLSIESHSVSGVLFGNFPGLRSVLVSDVFRSRFSCEDILCYLLRAKRAYRYHRTFVHHLFGSQTASCVLCMESGLSAGTNICKFCDQAPVHFLQGSQ